MASQSSPLRVGVYVDVENISRNGGRGLRYDTLREYACRDELLGFSNVSYNLRCESDVFVSGYLIPGLLPAPVKMMPVWGEVGSRVKGTCYHYNAEKGFGFLRYLMKLENLTVTDTREPD